MPWTIIYCLCFGCSHHQCAHHVHHSPMFMVCKIHFVHDACGWLGWNHQNTPATNFKEHFGKVAAPCLGECIWNARYPPPCASARFRICGMGFIGILLPSNVSKFICNLVVHSTKPPTTCDRVVDSVDSPAALLNQRGEQSNVWVLWSLMYFDPRWGPPPAMQWWPKGFHRARPKKWRSQGCSGQSICISKQGPRGPNVSLSAPAFPAARLHKVTRIPQGLAALRRFESLSPSLVRNNSASLSGSNF